MNMILELMRARLGYPSESRGNLREELRSPASICRMEELDRHLRIPKGEKKRKNWDRRLEQKIAAHITKPSRWLPVLRSVLARLVRIRGILESIQP